MVNNAYPRFEMLYKKWRIQCDKSPFVSVETWDWMIETEKNGPVFWHKTTGSQPTLDEIRAYIDESSPNWLC